MRVAIRRRALAGSTAFCEAPMSVRATVLTTVTYFVTVDHKNWHPLNRSELPSIRVAAMNDESNICDAIHR